MTTEQIKETFLRAGILQALEGYKRVSGWDVGFGSVMFSGDAVLVGLRAPATEEPLDLFADNVGWDIAEVSVTWDDLSHPALFAAAACRQLPPEKAAWLATK